MDNNDEKALAEVRKQNARFQNCIAAGNLYTVGLKVDGTVVAIGYNEAGQCNTGRWRSIVAIASGGMHTVGLKVDGTVVAVGHNEAGQCDTGSWRGIVAVAAGSLHTVGLKADGTVVTVGNNKQDQCDTGSWRGIVAIAAGMLHTAGLKSDGMVVTVGPAYCGPTDSWRNIVAIAAGAFHTVGLKADGAVVEVGNSKQDQCDTESWRGIVAIAAGVEHTVGLKSDGTVVAVGGNKYGQRDTGSWRNIVAIAAGAEHTVGLKADGTVVAIGKNEDDQCNTENWRGIGPVSEEQVLKNKQVKKTEMIEKAVAENPSKRLQYIDGLQGYFSRDFSIMRDEYVSLAEILKDEEKIKHCNKRAVECRQEYNRLVKEEEPDRNKKKRKSAIGTILQLVITIAYSIALWSTDYIHAIWNINNYLYKLLPLAIFSLLIGAISLLSHRDSHNAGWGIIFDLYAGIAQLITACVWVFGGNFRFFNFIGYLIIHAILIFIVLIPGWILSFMRHYKEDDIACTIVKNPSKTDVKKYDEMLSRHKKFHGNNHAETGIVYHNLGVVYAYFNENDIALEYYQNALEIFLSVHGEEHLDTALAYFKIGLIFNDLDNTEKALEYYRMALKVREKLLPPGHQDITNISKKIIEIEPNNPKEAHYK